MATLLILGLPNSPARSFVLIREAPPDCHHSCAVCAITAHQTLCPGNLHVLGAHRDSHHVLPFSSQPKKGNHGMNQARNHHCDGPAWGLPTLLGGYPHLQPRGGTPAGPLTTTSVTQGRFTAWAGLQVGAPHPLSIIPTGEISLEIGLISERGDKN